LLRGMHSDSKAKKLSSLYLETERSKCCKKIAQIDSKLRKTKKESNKPYKIFSLYYLVSFNFPFS
jgi:hypothetical protein